MIELLILSGVFAERNIQGFPERVPWNHDDGERRGLANRP